MMRHKHASKHAVVERGCCARSISVPSLLRSRYLGATHRCANDVDLGLAGRVDRGRRGDEGGEEGEAGKHVAGKCSVPIGCSNFRQTDGIRRSLMLTVKTETENFQPKFQFLLPRSSYSNTTRPGAVEGSFLSFSMSLMCRIRTSYVASGPGPAGEHAQ